MSGTIYNHTSPTWLISSTPISWKKPSPPSGWNPAHWFDDHPALAPLEGDDAREPCNMENGIEVPKYLLVGDNGKPKNCPEITQQDLDDGIATQNYSHNQYGAHFAGVGTKCEDFIGVRPLKTMNDEPRRPDLPFDSEFTGCKTRNWGEDGSTICVDKSWNCSIAPEQVWAENRPGVVINDSKVGPGNKLYSRYSNINCQLGANTGDPRFNGRWPNLVGNPPVRTWKPIIYTGAPMPSWRNICANYWPSDPEKNFNHSRCSLKNDISADDYRQFMNVCASQTNPTECENADPLNLVKDGIHGVGCVWNPKYANCVRQECEEMESINGFCPTVMCDWKPQDGPDRPPFGTGTRPVWPPPPAPPPPPPPPSPCQDNILDLEPNPFLPPGQESDEQVTKYYIYNQMCKAAETGRMVDGKDESEELCGKMNDSYRQKLGVDLCQHTQVNGGKSPGTCRIRECSDMYQDSNVCPEEMVGKDGNNVKGPCVLWDWNKK